MADIKYQVAVDTANGVQSLKKLQGEVEKTSNGFSGFGKVLGGLAAGAVIGGFTAAIRSSLNAVDELAKSARALGTSFSGIQALQRSASLAGISAEQLTSSLQRLQVNIGQGLAKGTGPAVDAMAKLGLSLSDVAKLPVEEQLLAITDALKGIENPSERSALAVELLGKQGPKLLETADNMRRMKQEIDSMGLALNNIDTAAIEQANDSMSELGFIFQSVMQKAAAELAPYLIAIAGYIKDSVLEGGNLGKAFVEKVIPAIKAAAQAFVLFVSIIVAGKLVAIFAAAATAVVSLYTAIKTASIAMASFNAVAARNPIALIAQGLVALGIAGIGIYKVNEAFSELDDEVKKILTDLEKQQAKLAETNAEGVNGTGEVIGTYKDLRLEIAKVVESLASVNQNKIKDIELNSRLLGSSREQIELEKSAIDLTRRAQEETDKLIEKKNKLTDAQLKLGLGGVIDQQIAKIKQQTEEDLLATQTAIKNSQERIRAFDLERFARQSNLDVERDIRRIQDDINKSTMSEMERKQYDILAAARERAKAEIAAEQARRGSLLTDQEKLKFYEAAKQGTDELIAKERQLYAESRTFSTGWKKAFQEYTDNATNAAQAAQRVFQKATQGMEDAIIGFVKTGKFEFKSFVNSMLEELLRSQIRQVMSQILSISGGTGQASGGGLFGQIGNFLGFANGGIIPTNEPVIVGERGPELLMGAAGRNVIPNEKLGSSNYVTYNINAMDARSFKDMVAQDPSFIHAVAMQGARSTPGRR